MSRSCGQCQACCVVPEIVKLGKPAKAPCRHLRSLPGEQGCCGIYHARPDVCKAFRCAWMDGFGGDEDRPDKAGVFAYRDRAVQDRFGAPDMLLAVELRAGAYEESAWLAEREREHPVYVIPARGILEGPRGKGAAKIVERQKERNHGDR